MEPLAYVITGVIIAIVLVYAFFQAFAYGLAGKSPILLRPFQILLVGSPYEKLRLGVWTFVITSALYLLYKHTSVHIQLTMK
jgi:hypothetical protein